MNEGHSAFFQLERIREMVADKSIPLDEAMAFVSSNCVFTTHTPVPAGNEAFDLNLVHKYFKSFADKMQMSWDDFIELGLVREKSDHAFFSLTVLAINLSRFQNGVSRLHGKVSKQTRYSDWAEKHGIKYHCLTAKEKKEGRIIPREWLFE